MNESIENQIRAVLDKYDYSYGDAGVKKALGEWEQKKLPLINLLRKHQAWDEDMLAIIFEVTEFRGIDKNIVLKEYDALKHLAQYTPAYSESGDYRKVMNAIYSLVTRYEKVVSCGETAKSVIELTGVNCAVNQKVSKAVGGICRKFGIDKHPDYNRVFAKLADSLNPLNVERRAYLSVHPCSYLEMSNAESSWTSSNCHRLNNGGGEYHSGVMSYLSDSMTMIFFTTDNGISPTYFSKPKRTRQVFCYGDGILLQSRLYPDPNDDETRRVYRNIVQKAIADSLEVPNLWSLKAKLTNYIGTHDGATFYPDYKYYEHKANVSILKQGGGGTEKIMVIGCPSICIRCGSTNNQNSTMFCYECDSRGEVTCHSCDNGIDREDAYFIDGSWYCDECCSYCYRCDTRVRDYYSVRDSSGNEMWVCGPCRDNHYRECCKCEQYHPDDEVTDASGDYNYCKNCLVEECFLCDERDEWYRYDDTEQINDGDMTYCEDCAPENEEEPSSSAYTYFGTEEEEEEGPF